MTFFGMGKKSTDSPPSYDELQAANNNGQSEDDATLRLRPFGDNEYPQEKGLTSALGQDANYGGQGYNIQIPDGSNNGYGGSSVNNGPGSNGGPPGFQANYTTPVNMYAVPLEVTNIAYDTEGRVTRPGYKQYLQADQQHVAQGDVPKPRSAFRHGAPLASSRKGGSLSSGAFPGAKGTTYYNTSERK